MVSGMSKVTDPELLKQLEEDQSGFKKVTDPELLAQLDKEPITKSSASPAQKRLSDYKKQPDSMMEHALGNSVGLGSLNKALSNLLPSTGNVIEGTINSIVHPIDTAKGLSDIVGGGLGKIIPNALRTYDPERNTRQDQAANNFGNRLQNRFGSFDKLKNTFENDPAGLMADLSMVASPFSAKAANSINPVNIAVKGVSSSIPSIGSLLAELVGGLGTKTGGETLREAARAGIAGGQKGEDFLNNLSDNVPMTDVVDTALKGQKNLANKSFQDYQANTAQSFSNQAPLDLQKIRDAVTRSNAIDITPDGIDLNPSTAPIKASINNLVSQFENKGLNKIVNFDEMKRGIGNIMKTADPSKPEYRAAANVYHELKNEIVNQDPSYGKAMAESEKSLGILNELKRELSLNPKANVGTTLRKLQSVTRNNANTSYGQRVSLAKLLEDNGAENLMAKLAGQSLNSWYPRGIAGSLTGPTSVASYMSGGPIAAGASLLLQSPKAMGLASYGLGKVAGKTSNLTKNINLMAKKFSIDPAILSNLMFESQQNQ
jgi:hypothetical protein